MVGKTLLIEKAAWNVALMCFITLPCVWMWGVCVCLIWLKVLALTAFIIDLRLCGQYLDNS